MTKKNGCPRGSHRVKSRCRSIKKMNYHGRIGNPILHETDDGRLYIMVRPPSGRGVKRLYLDKSGNVPKKYRGA